MQALINTVFPSYLTLQQFSSSNEKDLIASYGKDATGDIDFFQTVIDGKTQRKLIIDNPKSAVLLDGAPVSEGHALVFPKRPVSSFFNLTSEEVQDVFKSITMYIERLKTTLKAKYGHRYEEPDFNIGINVGQKAGQTRGRCHIHVIPRYKNDINDPEGPKGGVRGLFMDSTKKNYKGKPDPTVDNLF